MNGSFEKDTEREVHELHRVHFGILNRREDRHCVTSIQWRYFHQPVSQRKGAAYCREKRTHPVLAITIEPFFTVYAEDKVLYLLRRGVHRLG